MNTNDCDRVRMQLMASADKEAESIPSLEQEHVSSCESCQRWIHSFESLTTRLQSLPYPGVKADAWREVSRQIHQGDPAPSLTRQLGPIVVLTLAWRALQLFVDLPMPAFHLLVPVATAVWVAWRVGRRLLAIETWAPELHERGI